MPKRLKPINSGQLEELRNWLTAFDIDYNRLDRNFSDGYVMAKFLKRLHPKLVDIHNYEPRCRTSAKLYNWETLNKKVLVKLNLLLTPDTLEKLARGCRGKIESLLHVLMVQLQPIGDDEYNSTDEDEDSEDVMTVTMNEKIGQKYIRVKSKVIKYGAYERQLKELQEKTQHVNELNEKLIAQSQKQHSSPKLNDKSQIRLCKSSTSRR